MQSALDKAQGQCNRVTKEKDGIQLELDRLREKNGKNAVSYFFVSIEKSFILGVKYIYNPLV